MALILRISPKGLGKGYRESKHLEILGKEQVFTSVGRF